MRVVRAPRARLQQLCLFSLIKLFSFDHSWLLAFRSFVLLPQTGPPPCWLSAVSSPRCRLSYLQSHLSLTCCRLTSSALGRRSAVCSAVLCCAFQQRVRLVVDRTFSFWSWVRSGCDERLTSAFVVHCISSTVSLSYTPSFFLTYFLAWLWVVHVCV